MFPFTVIKQCAQISSKHLSKNESSELSTAAPEIVTLWLRKGSEFAKNDFLDVTGWAADSYGPGWGNAIWRVVNKFSHRWKFRYGVCSFRSLLRIIHGSLRGERRNLGFLSNFARQKREKLHAIGEFCFQEENLERNFEQGTTVIYMYARTIHVDDDNYYPQSWGK